MYSTARLRISSNASAASRAMPPKARKAKRKPLKPRAYVEALQFQIDLLNERLAVYDGVWEAMKGLAEWNKRRDQALVKITKAIRRLEARIDARLRSDN